MCIRDRLKGRVEELLYLTFVWDDLYYLYGVVSTKVKEENSFITFTNVSTVELSKWLNYANHALDAALKELKDFKY